MIYKVKITAALIIKLLTEGYKAYNPLEIIKGLPKEKKMKLINVFYNGKTLDLWFTPESEELIDQEIIVKEKT